MTLRPLLLALLPLAACIALDHEVATIEESADAAGVSGLIVDAAAGALVVEGDAALESIEVIATLRSAVGSDHNDEEVLAATTVRFEEVGEGLLRLEVRVPERYPAYSADVVVRVPEGQDLEVRDGAGDLSITDVGALRVDDGAGDIRVDGVAGDAEIRDGAGDIFVSRVDGDVRVDDGSGDLVIESVRGTVSIVDGSGDIVVRDAGEVVLLDDGSGDVWID